MTSELAPEHCGQPMYRDFRRRETTPWIMTDMRRWLCAEPGCQCVVSYDTLAAVREMAWADEHGIQLPGVTIIGGES